MGRRGVVVGYLASAAFARSGKVLRPIMTGSVSRRFRAELLETVA